ncbi:Ldh family oxidoreductase [Amaricoccus solimangrovi]|uniref:Ldh family oxidoreductase n=1 Tax=Amaricoccus solimangrovi TaxID=2589815 RepID=A0A501WRI4_9RHOB|nr:Ldh family oxidoreductase [Amaricoccus solimangrovi]TPE51432.1 Ldh family oxidoreductase [Amaricoccus solimangrovi]
MTDRHDPAELTAFAEALFAAAGLEPGKAAAVATYLVAADLMGHTTHGLGLAAMYLKAIADGTMTAAGDPGTVSDRGAAICWNGRRLPGAWLTSEAVKLAAERAKLHGTATVAIGDSHHNGALATYLTLATDQGLMVSIASSAPSGAHVAPFGGRVGVFSPDPVAHGIPTGGDPILIDISASITTFNMAQRMIREGRLYEHDWLLDRAGNPSRDPKALGEGGSLLTAGGLDHGQKGYGMALQVEALTQGLAGHGRAEAPRALTLATTVQVWDPEAFGGREAFLRQTGWLARACLASPPRPGVAAVRLPGQAGLARRRAALAEGVALHPGILESLAPHAERLGVPLPAARGVTPG